MHHSSHLDTAKKLLSAYKPGVPLHLHLKAYFRQNKKHGSKDRKLITTLCYSYFRLGFAFKDTPIEERILIGFFLCQQSHSDFLHFFKPGWNDIIGKPINRKLAILDKPLEIDKIFPFKDELSNEIDCEKFNPSFLKQPKLFIRVRPGYENIVPAKLQQSIIPYEEISSGCIALPNSSQIDKVIELDKEAVVQDYNSQRVGELVRLATGNKPSAMSVWDCCAASGGKSIMAYDINPSIQLTVSDKRESILQNLRQRFAKAGIKNYTSFIADLSMGNQQPAKQSFDLIIADVPCTGSGTWSRTPEQLYYFNQKQIKKYSDLQKQIIENAIPNLNPGGWFLYITCSVFRKENDDAVSFIRDKFKMEIVKTKLLKGYEIEADTMFAALFKNP